jgi:hypothetical protein
MWWHYKEGDKVSWKQRDRKVRPNMDVSDYKEKRYKLTKLFQSKKINVRVYFDKSIELEDKYFYKGYFETNSGVNLVVRQIENTINNNTYYLLDNGRVIISGQLKLIEKNLH